MGSRPASAQITIAGKVISTGGTAISSAQITVRGTNLGAVSDSSGAFEIRGVTPGRVILDVRRIGFTAQEFPIELAAGRDRRVLLALPVIAQTLPDVRVADSLAKPPRLAGTHRYDVFYERRAHGIGTFFTREDIDRQFKTNTPELLQTLSGVKVRRNGNEWKVQFTRCQMGIPGAADPGRFIQVFIDGRYAGRANELNTINPAEIEAMEVYRSPAELPPQARGDGCGAVFIWLRSGS
ncbi:MAG TPA: carboxypeptidase regulatory-like domain-containing protein [Gemmatimonadaceae bacterium]|nr:carboxypeptidase regulatory-like domain-containing protein [Gemmatimonadaceae bacterium]